MEGIMEDNEKLAENIGEETEEAAENTAAESEDSETVSDEQETAEDGDEEEDESSDKEGASNLMNDIVEIVESTLITMFVVVLIFTYLLHPVNVVGSSMEPTLIDGNKVFMTTVFSKVKYGDIIIIDNDKAYLLDDSGNVVPTSTPLDECIIKRVIATEGQVLDITADAETGKTVVTVDGKVIDEPYLMKDAQTYPNNFEGKFPLTIPDGYCFAMGDNRNRSADSRSSAVGLIKEEQIYGKAVFRYSPISDMCFLFNSEKRSAYEN